MADRFCGLPPGALMTSPDEGHRGGVLCGLAPVPGHTTSRAVRGIGRRGGLSASLAGALCAMAPPKPAPRGLKDEHRAKPGMARPRATVKPAAPSLVVPPPAGSQPPGWPPLSRVHRPRRARRCAATQATSHELADLNAAARSRRWAAPFHASPVCRTASSEPGLEPGCPNAMAGRRRLLQGTNAERSDRSGPSSRPTPRSALSGGSRSRGGRHLVNLTGETP